ncbi:MAG: efflux RND transporter periplasmic adaptor subunit, partial [Bacteroidota bacterium]
MKNWITTIKTHYKWALALVLISFTLGAVLVNTTNSTTGESTEKTLQEDHSHDEEEATTWTCSMHPQIKQDKPGQCPICGMDLIPLESTDSGSDEVYPDELVMTEAASKLAELQTSVVKHGSPEKIVHLQGKVQADERNIAKLTARFGGRIEELSLNFTGEFVEKGQPLATLYSPELMATQQELIEAAKVKEQHPSMYQSAKAKLRLWDLSENQIAQIEKQQDPDPYFQILSPVRGTVMKRQVAKGAYVKKGDPLFEVTDLSSVWVLFDAYESDLPWINKGNKVTFTVEAFPGKQFETKITFIDPFLNAQERVAKLRAEVPNPKGHLKPGMFVSGKISGQLEDQQNPLLIPKSAVLWTGKRAVVYVKVPDREMPSFLFREITLGAEAGDYYVVAEGLSEGQEVVTNGVFKIDAASQLQGLPSMMNAQGGMQSTGHAHGQEQQAAGSPKESTEGVHTSFRVGGNCSMCKDRIEKAARSVAGVAEATWEQESGIL